MAKNIFLMVLKLSLLLLVDEKHSELKRTEINQWFSDLTAHQNPLSYNRLLDPIRTPEFLI